MLSVSKDTFITSKYPNSNYGTSTQLKVGHPESGAPQYSSFIGFDLSGIPKNKVITNMVLKVFLYNLYNEYGGNTWDPSGTEFQFVIRARSMNGISLSELDTLTFNTVMGKTGINNPYATPNDAGDSAYSVANSIGSYIPFPVKNYSKEECVIALFYDPNYTFLSGYNAFNFFSKENSSYEPKLEVTYVDYVPPTPNNLIPNNTARNKNGSIKLSWVFEDTIMATSQTSYEVLYSIDNFATSTAVTGTTNNYNIIPANTFNLGATVKWKVRITDSNGDVSAWSEIASFTIGDTLPSAPEVISPLNTIINSSDIVFFRWKFADLYGYSQVKFDLEYKSGAVSNTATLTTANNYYAMPVNTLVGGDYSWRVRCYNAFGEVGPYSNWNTFYSIGKPSLPVISSISNNMHPTVQWSANEQDLFIVNVYKDGINIFSSGEQTGGVVNSYKIPEFLKNGNYKLGLKTSNVYGFWSDEITYNFTISVSSPSKPIAAGNENNYFIALIITSSTPTNLVYRKGEKESNYILVGTIQGNTYEDYSAPSGINQYFVRSVTDVGYADSDVFSISLNFDGIVISGYDNQSDLIHLYLTKDSDKRPNVVPMKDQFRVHCNGRDYPISQSTRYKNHSENHEYFIKPSEYDDFYRISDYNVILYRNNHGYSFAADITNVSIQENEFGYVVVFSINRLEV